MGNCVKPVDPLLASMPKHRGIDAKAVGESGLPIIFLIGGPGSGKRTLCAKLAEKYDLLCIISTDLLRNEVSTRSERGFVVANLMSEGRLVPPELLLELIKEKMLRTLSTAKGFILSGFPREREQCKLFDKQVRPPDLVIYLSVSNSLLMDRAMAKTVTTIQRQFSHFDPLGKRISDFRRLSKPVLKHYKKKLVTIDGEKEVPGVLEDICAAMDAVLKNVPANQASTSQQQ